MEKEVECWMKSYTKVSCPPPIGTANSEPMEEDELEEDEEEDEHDNEDSDSRCVLNNKPKRLIIFKLITQLIWE